MSTFKFREGTPEGDRLAVERFASELEANKKPAATNYSAFGARKVDETSHGPIIEAIAVSEGVKRDGSTIRVKGIDLTNLRSNPVLMFGHNYSQPPIGRIVDFRKSEVTGLGKVLKIRFSPLRTQVDTEHKRFADSIFDMLIAGDLRTVSFGWKTVEAEPLKDESGYMTGWDFIRTDAMETSVVAVPADPQALITKIQQRGLDPERFVVNRNSGSSIYEVREVLPDGLDLDALIESDEEVDPIVEKREEKVEEKKDEAPVIDFEKNFRELMERFTTLEQRFDNIPLGENRKGAVLNAANRKALTDAMQLIGAVIKNAGEPTADTEKASSTPEVRSEEKPVEDEDVEVKFEDIADIRRALEAKREEAHAATILGELVRKRTAARSKG